jgi:hypothetical protein
MVPSAWTATMLAEGPTKSKQRTAAPSDWGVDLRLLRAAAPAEGNCANCAMHAVEWPNAGLPLGQPRMWDTHDP